jgi:death-on-curing protein
MSLIDDYGTYLTVDGITYMDEMFIDGLHDAAIRIHGGLEGKRQDSLGTICQNAFYHPDKSVEGLAAYYLSRIVKGHPFNDGNKRAGFLTSVLFLGANSRKYEIYDGEFAATEIANIADAINMDKAYEYSKIFVERHISNPVYGSERTIDDENSIGDVTYILSGI